MKLLYKILLILSFSFSFGQSSVCDTAEAMCSGNQGPFNNLSGQPNNNSLGCLGTTPNRAWFYMQVGTSGTMNFQLSQISTGGAGIDVDFILWGPFNSLTGICNNLALYSPGYVGSNNVVACSYSTAAVENFTIPNAVAGQYYMLLVTNYRDLPGTYTLNQTGGSGALSCDIVCGVTLGPDRILCGTSSSVTLNANFLQAPSLQGSPIYTWYLNDVQQFTTPTNSTTVNQSGTWKVSVTRPGCSDVATDEVEVQFIGVVPFNNIGPIATPAGQCNPIIDLTSYQSALVAPYDPVSFVFVYYDGSGNVIANPSTFSPTTSTTIAIEIIAGPCSNFDTVGIVVDCVPPTCNLTLTSASSTTNQIVCLGSPLTNIVYSSTGTVSNVTVSGLPTGLTSSYSNQVFTITGTPTQTGIFNYTVSTVGCTTNDTKSGTIRVIEVPTVPTTSQVAPTCDAPTTTTISNYSNAVTYIFSPTGPSVASSGVVSGMVVGTSYTVSATNGTCPTSPSGSFVNNAQLTLPLTPAISIATPTCSSNGIATISNYVSGLNYTFTPTGPTVSSTGVVSGMNVGQNYVVLANNGSCSSSNTSSFMIESRLPAPVAPSITNTNPTCNASGTTTISNYSNAVTYIFSPTGPSVASSGVVSGMVVGTSYTVSATNGTCPTSPSGSFVNNAQLITPSAPTLTVLDDLICFGETAVFQISGMPGSNVTYSINNGSSQSVTLTNQGTASVEIVDSSDTVNIELLSISNGNCTFNFSDSDAVSIQLCDIPKGVSPNGDGLNDTWDLGGYNVKKVEIFNRYGTKVYSKSNYVDEWHGQSDNSNELPDGTYYYVVEFNDSPVKTGWVYINREQ
jgi:gliding motility-associated-like protein